MKNFYLIVLFFAGILQNPLFAQLKNQFSIGPRIGINLANTNADNTKTLTSLTAGLTSTYSLNEKSGLSVDLLYSGEGYKLGNTEYKINYLKVPILYDIFFGKLGEPFRPKIYLGFAPGFLINAEAGSNSIKSQFKSSVFDLVGGLGFNYRLGDRIWLNADLRALLGLATMTNSGDVKNRTIQVSLGIAYGI